jgi:O-acetyl-ADP-ribose deacetylase (regulator of RNase III)
MRAFEKYFMLTVRNTTIEIVRGSVIDQNVDAIVNAANTSMRGGGGIDGAIHRAAGNKLLEELRRAAPKGSATGEAIVTTGHDLNQPYIIHVAGPIYRNYEPAEAARLLAACYSHALEAAEERNLTSIGFCSISTGVYGYPIEEAAPLALETAQKYFYNRDSVIRRVVFAMFTAHEFDVFSQALKVLL